jgi:hypothetical protein
LSGVVDIAPEDSLTHVSTKKAGCGGNACAECGNCCDWRYTGDTASWNWICNSQNWSSKDWQNWDEDRVADRFIRRNGGTCRDLIYHYRRDRFVLNNRRRHHDVVHYLDLLNIGDYYIRRFPVCCCSK